MKEQFPQKVIILGSAYPLRGGGIATYNERLATEYVRQGVDVEIVTFSLQYPKLLFPGKTQFSEENPPKDLKIKVMVNSINPFNWLKVGRYIRTQNADLMVVRYWIPFMSPCLGTISRIVKKNKKTKIISIVDNIIPHEKRPFDKLLSKYFVKSVHGFLTMSQAVLKDLSKFDKQKPRCFVQHPLYDNFGESLTKTEAMNKLQLNPDFHYILFFGFIRDYKGLDLLLKAMNEPQLRKLPIKLLIAGEFYAKKEQYIELIDNLNIKDSIVLHTDFIPNTEVATYFSAADLIVQPYKTATQSGVTQIAYHFEKPIVTTNVGGLAEIVPNGKVGYVIEPEVNAIAVAICRFFVENKYESFHLAMKEEKQKFSWQTLTNALNTLC